MGPLRKILRDLKKLGYVPLTNSSFCGQRHISVKFQSGKSLYSRKLIKLFYHKHKHVDLEWNHKSIEDWVSKRIPRENVWVDYFARSEIAIRERPFRRVYLLDRKSIKSPPKFDKKGNGHGPRLILMTGSTLDTVVRNALAVIKKHRLKKYKFVVFQHLTYFVGYVGAGGEWDYWKKVWKGNRK